MARYDDLNTTIIGYVTFVSSVLLLIIILLVRALCYSWIDGEDQRKLADAHYVAADQAISEQKAAVSRYAKVMVEVAPAEGESVPPAATTEAATPVMQPRLHIPVERAKRLLLEELESESKDSPST